MLLYVLNTIHSFIQISNKLSLCRPAFCFSMAILFLSFFSSSESRGSGKGNPRVGASSGANGWCARHTGACGGLWNSLPLVMARCPVHHPLVSELSPERARGGMRLVQEFSFYRVSGCLLLHFVVGSREPSLKKIREITRVQGPMDGVPGMPAHAGACETHYIPLVMARCPVHHPLVSELSPGRARGGMVGERVFTLTGQ